jgi:dolichyl-phosphate beta-glucosyltransferase
MKPLRLTVVIPAFDEEARLPRTLRRVVEYLVERGEPFEIIVVDDGSLDGTAKVAEGILRALGPRGRVLRNECNRGKGASIRRGMLAARGQRVLFSDADLSTPIEELAKLEHALDAGAKVAIGSRAVERALVEKPQNPLRDMMGRLFNLLVRVFAIRGISDTQCGFKLFAGDVVGPIFARQRLERFGFDVEVLAIARYLGHPIAEVGVRWLNDPATKVTLLGGASAFLDPIRVRVGMLRGQYAECPSWPDEETAAPEVGEAQ